MLFRSALVEIYQNCPIFNDGAFQLIKDRDSQAARLVKLVDGEPVTVGVDPERKVLVREPNGSVAFVPEAEAAGRAVVVHDASDPDPTAAFALSRLDDGTMTHVPMGVFRNVTRPTYDDLVREQVASAVQSAGRPADDAALDALLRGNDTWTVR